MVFLSCPPSFGELGTEEGTSHSLTALFIVWGCIFYGSSALDFPFPLKIVYTLSCLIRGNFVNKNWHAAIASVVKNISIHENKSRECWETIWNDRFLGRIKDKCLPLSRRDMLVGSQKFFEHLVSNNVGDIAAASNHQYTDFVAPHVPLAARYCIFSHMEIGSGVQR